MPKAKSLSNLKLSTLHSLLKSIGSRTSGTKSVRIQQLQHDVQIAKVSEKGTTRVLSIDMGIRNLAFCVCDVAIPGESTKPGPKSQVSTIDPIDISVKAWKRIAVTATSVALPSPKTIAEAVQKIKTMKSQQAMLDEDDPFSPRSLSATAYSLVKNMLLPYKPDTILIERQRFRTHGSSAVLDWTVRVNLFEAMLWSTLTTLRAEKSLGRLGKTGENGKFPDFWDVSPRRVNSFWFEKGEGAEMKGKRVGRLKVEKKDKIELVRKWISTSESENIRLEFSDDAMLTKDTFVKRQLTRSKQVVKVPMLEIDKEGIVELEKKESIGKLDDLADCLLQAASWAKWEGNRRAILPMVEEEDVDKIMDWVKEKE